MPKNNFKTKNWQGAGLGEHPINFGTLIISATVEVSNFKFGTKLMFGSSIPKTTFRTKIAGGRAMGTFKNIWDPYLFLQPLKLATSNLVYNLGLGSSLIIYQETSFRTKNNGVLD